MHVYVMRVNDEDGRRWWLYGAGQVRKGGPKNTKRAMLEKWIAEFGKPESVTSYKGTMRPSEAVMSIGALERAEKRQEEANGQ